MTLWHFCPALSLIFGFSFCVSLRTQPRWMCVNFLYSRLTQSSLCSSRSSTGCFLFVHSSLSLSLCSLSPLCVYVWACRHWCLSVPLNVLWRFPYCAIAAPTWLDHESAERTFFCEFHSWILCQSAPNRRKSRSVRSASIAKVTEQINVLEVFPFSSVVLSMQSVARS